MTRHSPADTPMISAANSSTEGSGFRTPMSSEEKNREAYKPQEIGGSHAVDEFETRCVRCDTKGNGKPLEQFNRARCRRQDPRGGQLDLSRGRFHEVLRQAYTDKSFQMPLLIVSLNTGERCRYFIWMHLETFRGKFCRNHLRCYDFRLRKGAVKIEDDQSRPRPIGRFDRW